jgi:hypothetical protein
MEFPGIQYIKFVTNFCDQKNLASGHPHEPQVGHAAKYRTRKPLTFILPFHPCLKFIKDT